MLQVDIGQGWKPPGHYVQRSCGLFPAPYPQNSPEIDRICKVFELLGIFIAKCIQDKRRVDLPLARPFFKLMTTCTRLNPLDPSRDQKAESDTDHVNGITQSRNNEDTEDGENDTLQQEQEPSNRGEHVSQHIDHPSSQNDDVVVVGAATSAKEAELQKLVTKEEEEITKDQGGEKELVLEELGDGGGEGELEATWFRGIFQLETLEEVNPHR